MKFVNGDSFNAWQSFELRESFSDPLGEMRFTARPARELISKYAANLQRGELVGIIVNNAIQGSMLIQEVVRTIDRGGVTFEVSCQSVLATPYEANAPPDYAFASKSDTPISAVVLDIMRPFGFEEVFIDAADDISVKLGSKGKKRKHSVLSIGVDDLKHQDCQVQESETAYGVCDRIINRLGLCLRADVNGSLLVCRPNYDQEAVYTIVQSFKNATKGNHMLDGIRLTETNRNQFSECVVRGTRSDKGEQKEAAQPAARVGIKGFRPATAPFGKVTLTEREDGKYLYRSNESVAPYKPKFFKDKKTRDNDRAKNLAQLILGMKSKDAYVLECEVDGLVSQEGHVWTVDTIAHVICEGAGIDEELWVAERTLSCSRERGMTTRLKLIPKGGLILGEIPSGS